MISNLHMETDAPVLDLGVEGRLRRLDSRLRLVWSSWEIDPSTSLPLVTRAGGRIYGPAWHLWILEADGWHHIRQYDARRKVGEGDQARMESRSAAAAFGHRQVLALERGPRLSGANPAAEAARAVRDAMEERTERMEREQAERRRDFQKANGRRMRDLATGKSGRRQAKMVSYAGQGRRSTPGVVLENARRDGWEYPPVPKESACSDEA